MNIDSLVELFESEAREYQEQADKIRETLKDGQVLPYLCGQFDGTSFGFTYAAAKLKQHLEG